MAVDKVPSDNPMQIARIGLEKALDELQELSERVGKKECCERLKKKADSIKIALIGGESDRVV